MDKVLESKIARQHQAIDDWRDRYGRGTIVAPTGFGKSWIGRYAYQRMYKKNPNLKCGLVAPTGAIVRQWEDNYGDGIICRTIQSLVSNPKSWEDLQGLDLLIVDEVHRFGGEEFSKIFSSANYKFILCLTATLERQDGKHHLIANRAPVCHEIPVVEAEQKGWIMAVREYNIPIVMNPADHAKYQGITDNFKSYFRKLDNDFRRIAAFSWHRRKNGQVNHKLIHYANLIGAHPEKVCYWATQAQKLMMQRKQFLYNYPAKLSMVQKIYNEFSDERLIFYGESVSFAESIYENVVDPSNAVFIRSGMTPKRRKEAEAKAIEGHASHVVAAKALDEGFDVPGLSVAINSSYTASKAKYKQRRGRINRTSSNKSQPIMLNLYVQDTQEKVWLDRAQAESVNVQHVIDPSSINDKVPKLKWKM